MSLDKSTEPKAWLSRYVYRAGTYLGLSVGLGLSAGILLILQASVLAWIVDRVVFAGDGLSRAMPGLWLMLGLIGGRAGAVWASTYFSGLAGAQVKTDMRRRLLEHMEKVHPLSLASRSSGALIHLVVDGVEEVEGYFSGYLPHLALAVLIPLAILGFVFPLDWISGLVLLLTAPFLPFFMAVIGRRAEKLNQQQWRKISRLSHRFLDAIQGLTTLKMFNAGQREIRIVREISEDYAKSSLSVLRVAFLSALVLECMATVSVAVLAVLIGFRLLWGEMDFQTGFFILLLAPEFYLPLRSLGTFFHARMSALAAAENMIRLLHIPTREDEEKGQKHELSSIQISFQDVCYTYEPGRPGVQEIRFSTPTSGLVCLTGASGSGKTTILRLIMGLIRPEGGCITINGQNLAELNKRAWLEHIAYVPQRPHLFARSVRDNIGLGNEQASQSEIERAAARARIKEEIQALPQGWDTLLGEDGLNLSGGQRQRVALARAFVRDCPLILVDEPGSGLDTSTRGLIYEALRDLAQTRLVIASTHDPDLLPFAVQVV